MPVAPLFLWTMCCVVIRVDFLHCTIMMSGISLPHFCMKCVLGSLLNQSCSLLAIQMSSLSLLLTHRRGVRLDVTMNGLWGAQSERCFVDVRVFNPYAASNKCSFLSATYKKHENIKRHAYSQWIRKIKHSSFMPLVMPATGGSHYLLHALGFSFMRDSYAITLDWLHCHLSFSLLRSAITCLCGAQSSSGH